jgi:hypothetical protein
MKTPSILMGPLILLFLLGSLPQAEASHTSADTNIHFEVWDGAAWVDIASPSAAGNSTGTWIIPERTSANPVSIGGGNTITVEKMNASENIRIEWDDPMERLWLKNAKITSLNGPISNLRFRAWRKFANGSDSSMYYEGRGGGFLKRANGASAVGAQIVIRGSIETSVPSGSNNYIKGLSLPPLPCAPRPDKLVKCASSTSSTISWNDFEKDTTPHTFSGSEHVITLEFWLSLPQADANNKDYLQLTAGTTGGIRILGSSSPGGGRSTGTTECDFCQGADCATCPDCGSCSQECPTCPPVCPDFPKWSIVVIGILFLILIVLWRRPLRTM